MPDEGPNYFDEPITRFLDDAAAALPTPGGGSVSSLAAALGTTMAQMSAGFTLKPKRYEQFHEAVKPIAAKLARAQEMFRRRSFPLPLSPQVRGDPVEGRSEHPRPVVA